jgi:hypothetical protein
LEALAGAARLNLTMVSERWRWDGLAIGILLAMAAIFTLVIVRPVNSFTRGDWPTQFFPVYAYLGDRLRAFEIPGWNPHQFAGAPFAGDPESGWMYVPAMFLYALLPAEPATVAYIGMHIAAAGVLTYALARLLKLSIAGSLIGGASYAFAWVAPASMHLVIWFPVTVWLIAALIAIECDARAASWRSRLWGWLLGGVAISQILGVWLGQASYYALLAISAWVVYRNLVVTDGPASPRTRVVRLMQTGSAVFALGLGLSAAGLLPRLDAVSRSNLAGGVYEVASSWADAQTGFSPAELLYELVGGYAGSLWWYTGALAVSLAVISPVIAWRWRPMAFFVLTAVCSLMLALANPTPLHNLFYLLPRFAELHEHSPERVLMLFGPCAALLAAATVTYLPRWDWSPIIATAIVALPAAAILALTRSKLGGGTLVSPEATTIAVATGILATTILLTKNLDMRRAALFGLILLALWDPAGRIMARGFTDEKDLERSLRGTLAQDPEPFLFANGAADFLARQTAEIPGRYAGFDPALLPDPATIEIKSPDIGYRGWNSLKSTGVNWLLVHNWGTWFGIDDVQGYNPLQVERYVEYIDALNGHRQEYHERDIFAGGLSSPLLDLLNLRYLIVPADAPDREQFASLLAEHKTVYQDAHVRILENANAFPRAWLVHEARQVAPGAALPLLAEGGVDPRSTALVEAPPPVLGPATHPNHESASYVLQEADRLVIDVEADAPALLVLSEIWDPGWVATVDGQSAPIYLADHILRAIPVPAGSHAVELRYDPPAQRIGLIITLLSLAVAASAAGLATLRMRPRVGEETRSA